VQSFQSHAVQSSLSPVIVHGGSELITAHDWQPFEVRGVNYLRTTVDDPNRCAELQFGVDGNCGWNRQAIERDMDVLQSLGVNTVRVFLNFYAFGGSALISPSPTSSSDMAVAIHHLEQFITIANNRGIYVMPVLMAKYPQDRFTADDLKTVLDIHVHPVINYFSGHNGILAWDLFNEPDIAGPVDVRCWDWDNNEFPLCAQIATQRMLFLNVLRDEVKRLDPHKPLTISVAFAKSYFRPAGVYAVPLAELVDFYAIHYYDNDPYDSGRYAQHWYYGEGFPRDFERSIDELRAMGLGKPVVFTEVGFPSGDDAKRTLAEAQQDLRTARDTVRAKSGNGVILWPFQPDPRDLIHTLFE
jgi:endo-1,4-beta-mannosidase